MKRRRTSRRNGSTQADSAYAASTKAMAVGTPEAHREAAYAHDAAGDACELVGDLPGVMRHVEAARIHRLAAVRPHTVSAYVPDAETKRRNDAVFDALDAFPKKRKRKPANPRRNTHGQLRTPTSVADAKTAIRRAKKHLARAVAARKEAVESGYALGVSMQDDIIAGYDAAVAHFERWLAEHGPMKRNSDTQVGTIIAQQLGGIGRLRTMLGARDIYAIENGLQFGFPNGRRETGNKVVIKLEPSDTYRVEFWWVRGAKAILVKAFDDIYAEQLTDIFEKQTGLYLTMHPRRNSRKRTSRRAR